MEAITVKFEDNFAHNINKAIKKYNYSTKTELIREAVRDKLIDLEKKAALLRLQKSYGAGKKKGRIITDKDLHKTREKVAREIAKDLGVELD